MGPKGLSADEIYDTLADDELFEALPMRLASAFGGRSAQIHWHHADGEASVLAHSGYFTTAQLQLYATDFAATVRAQLRTIGSKMGCRRQTEIAVAVARAIGSA